MSEDTGFWVRAIGIAISATNEAVKKMGGTVESKITEIWTTNGSPNVTLTIRFDPKLLQEYMSQFERKGGDTCSK
jgi:hypothetical protein